MAVAGIFRQRFLCFLQNFSKFENRCRFVRQKHCDWIVLKCVGFGKHTDRSALNLLVSEGNSAGFPATVDSNTDSAVPARTLFCSGSGMVKGLAGALSDFVADPSKYKAPVGYTSNVWRHRRL